MSQDITMTQGPSPPAAAADVAAGEDPFDHSLLRLVKLHANRSAQAKLQNHNQVIGPSQSQDSYTDQKMKWMRHVNEKRLELKSLVQSEEKDNVEPLRSTLKQLKTSTSLSEHQQKKISLKAAEKANESAFGDVFFVPDAASPLNHLLAVRTVARVIRQTRETIEFNNRTITRDKEALSELLAAAKTSNEFNAALKTRVAKLEESTSTLRSEADEEIREKEAEGKLLVELEGKIKEYDKKSKDMMRVLKGFIEETLAPMIAVEEMGGVVAGMEQDIDVLKDIVAGEVGLDGKVKGKGGKGKKALQRGQKRIDELWRKKDRQEGDEEEEEEEDAEEGPVDPIRAAGKELMGLIETLMNSALSDSSSTYTTLPRESAAARLLVRSYVANLHPNNAFKLRLVEFGRGIEDG